MPGRCLCADSLPCSRCDLSVLAARSLGNQVRMLHLHTKPACQSYGKTNAMHGLLGTSRHHAHLGFYAWPALLRTCHDVAVLAQPSPVSGQHSHFRWHFLCALVTALHDLHPPHVSLGIGERIVCVDKRFRAPSTGGPSTKPGVPEGS